MFILASSSHEIVSPHAHFRIVVMMRGMCMGWGYVYGLVRCCFSNEIPKKITKTKGVQVPLQKGFLFLLFLLLNSFFPLAYIFSEESRRTEHRLLLWRLRRDIHIHSQSHCRGHTHSLHSYCHCHAWRLWKWPSILEETTLHERRDRYCTTQTFPLNCVHKYSPNAFSTYVKSIYIHIPIHTFFSSFRWTIYESIYAQCLMLANNIGTFMHASERVMISHNILFNFFSCVLFSCELFRKVYVHLLFSYFHSIVSLIFDVGKR